MPRIRTIKPQFWLDENLGQIKREARLLYIGLWNLSDDQGVFEWRPARIKVQLFPYDYDICSKEIEEWLEELIATGDISQFEYEGEIFGYIWSFLEHQEIKNPSQWNFAPVPEDLPIPTPALLQQGDSSTPALPLGKRKRNREKEKESIYIKFGTFNNVLLEKKEYDKILERFGKEKTEEKIEELSLAIKSKGYKYKSHYATILNWDRREKKDGEARKDSERDPRQPKRHDQYTEPDELP